MNPDLKLYENDVMIHAAVRQVADIVMYCLVEGDNLDEKLIEFFATWDRVRTDEVTRLKAELLKTINVFPNVKPVEIPTR